MTLRTFFSFLSFPFPLSSFLFLDLSRKDRSDSASRVDCRSFSVKKPMYLIEPYTISVSILRRPCPHHHRIYLPQHLVRGIKGSACKFFCVDICIFPRVASCDPIVTCVRPSPPLSNKHAIQSLITIAYHADMNIIPAGNEQCLNHTKFCDFAMLYELSSLMDTCISFIVESALSLSS